MKKLTSNKFAKTREFISNNARPLDQAMFMFYFENASASKVFAELEKYQNPDGGFGNSLEPALHHQLQLVLLFNTPFD